MGTSDYLFSFLYLFGYRWGINNILTAEDQIQETGLDFRLQRHRVNTREKSQYIVRHWSLEGLVLLLFL